MRVGIFGSGTMAKIYGEVLNAVSGVELVGLVGRSEEKTESIAAELKTKGFDGGRYDRLIDLKPDVVIVATPEDVRIEPIKALVHASIPIILEKPFAANWEDAKNLRTILSDHGKYFSICHVLRFSPRFSALHASIKSGQIGEPRHIYARRNSNNLRVNRVLGKTDLSYWLTPHDVDIMRWILNSEVEWVMATSRNGLKSQDDYLSVHLKFENGVDANLDIIWCHPPLSGVARQAIFEVHGTEGVVELNDGEMNVRVFQEQSVVAAPDTYEHFMIDGLPAGIFRNMMEVFLRDINLNPYRDRHLVDAFEATRVCAMISHSIREGRVVTRKEFSA